MKNQIKEKGRKKLRGHKPEYPSTIEALQFTRASLNFALGRLCTPVLTPFIWLFFKQFAQLFSCTLSVCMNSDSLHSFRNVFHKMYLLTSNRICYILQIDALGQSHTWSPAPIILIILSFFRCLAPLLTFTFIIKLLFKLFLFICWAHKK